MLALLTACCVWAWLLGAHCCWLPVSLAGAQFCWVAGAACCCCCVGFHCVYSTHLSLPT